MSLYGKSNTSQKSAIGSFTAASGLPGWLLALAGYFVLNTVTNNVESFISLIQEWQLNDVRIPFFNDERISLLIGYVTSVLSVIALLLFLFKRYSFCVYYLMVAALSDLSFSITMSFDSLDYLRPFFMRGLYSVPFAILNWTNGWGSMTESGFHVLVPTGSIVSLTFCGLLLYFHSKRQPQAQPL